MHLGISGAGGMVGTDRHEMAHSILTLRSGWSRQQLNRLSSLPAGHLCEHGAQDSDDPSICNSGWSFDHQGSVQGAFT